MRLGKAFCEAPDSKQTLFICNQDDFKLSSIYVNNKSETGAFFTITVLDNLSSSSTSSDELKGYIKGSQVIVFSCPFSLNIGNVIKVSCSNGNMSFQLFN